MSTGGRFITVEGAIGLVLATSVTTTGAMSRMGDAQVLEKDGQPCFVVPAKELARGPNVRVQAVSVGDESSKPVVTVWKAPIDPPATPSSLANCIAYGQLPSRPGDPPAAELQTGKVYEVYLNGRSSDSSDPTRGYTAKFCFMADGAGGRKLVPVTYPSRAWDEGVCR